MWLLAESLAAVDAPSGANDSLIVVIGGVVIAALGALGLVLVEVVKGRNSRAGTPNPPPPLSVDVLELAKDIAILKDWRVETRKADDLHDRALSETAKDVEDLVRFNDREHPEWRP